eukprot:g16008.t1
MNEGHLTWHVAEASRVMDVWVDTRSDPENGRVLLSLGQNDFLKGMKKKFGLKHLDIFSKGSSLADKIKIWLHAEHPACFHFDIENDPNLGWARFWLAPFVENDGLEGENQNKLEDGIMHADGIMHEEEEIGAVAG